MRVYCSRREAPAHLGLLSITPHTWALVPLTQMARRQGPYLLAAAWLGTGSTFLLGMPKVICASLKLHTACVHVWHNKWAGGV